ncbi:MAG: FHA domain-containing protein [Succinivibrionaceae bacterium]|nr:FHA domain-containing protein [Succinivibrionaceae bacterium]
MPRKKICPECSAANSPANPECTRCGADISGVKAINYSQEELDALASGAGREKPASGTAQASAEPAREESAGETSGAVSEKAPADRNAEAGSVSGYASSQAPATSAPPEISSDSASGSGSKSGAASDLPEYTSARIVKICPKCGTKNPRSKSKCACGENLRFVEPVKDGESTADPAPKPAASAPAATPAPVAAPAPAVRKEPAADGKPAVKSSEAPKSVPSGVPDDVVVIAEGEEYDEADTEMAKFCPDCHARADERAKICPGCGGYLTEVAPVRIRRKRPTLKREQRIRRENAVMATLVAPDGRQLLNVTTSQPTLVLGRENLLADYLESCEYVSRRHCVLALMGSRLTIRDDGSTNGTYVDSVKIQFQKNEQLKHNAQVSLGGVWNCQGAGCFTVRYPDEE